MKSPPFQQIGWFMEKKGGIIAFIAMMNSVKNKTRSYASFFAIWHWELLRF
ncbi:MULTISPECIES: hypothetical protein [Anoxybacillaceae]|uniref:hypothetical protein n=1 Tax=Anoxybacillaceae TaxID=3120669 RepID=UPI00137481AC|nr:MULTISPECIES: hypothetical protein [Anoxybacillus]MBB3909256.1 hypothetical protein [Anoxybacillus rupiensis]MBS2771142.1 hypothetical protein [Anoxybacillus rupiensis]